MEEFELKLLKWNELIKRKDYAQKKWWAFDCDTLTHPDFFEIPGAYFKVYCWVISVANKFGSDEIRMHKKHTCKVLDISEKEFDNAISHLHGKRWELRNSTDSLRTRTVSVPRVEKIREEESREDKIFDFEFLFSKYPNKVGHLEGIERLKDQIEDQQDFEDFLKAVENYDRFLNLPANKGWRRAQQFDVFVGPKSKKVKPWREWIDPDPSVYAAPENSKKEQPDYFLATADELFHAVKSWGAQDPAIEQFLGPEKFRYYIKIGRSKIGSTKHDAFGLKEIARIVKGLAQPELQGVG